MKKVALLKSRFSYRGGLEKYTLRLASAFASKGCRVTLLTTGEIDSLPLADVNIISLCPTSKFTLYHLLAFDRACQKWLKSHPQDIVFGLERTTHQTHYRAGSGVHAIYLKRRSLVESRLKCFSFQCNPLHHLLQHLEKKAFEAPDLRRLFTNSAMVKQEILQTYSVDPRKIAVVHNGVEWKEWENPFQKSLINPRQAPFQFLFIGNDFLRKGLPFLLHGLACLTTRDFHLSVVGKDKNLASFQHLAEKLSLTNNVTFHGPQKEILPFYQKADALVIPSIYDPFANVTVEALAMGLFVVSSAYNGGKEVLSEQNGCIIEELTDKHSVAAALKKALSHPKTPQSAIEIRHSIEQLDFSRQLNTIVEMALE